MTLQGHTADVTASPVYSVLGFQIGRNGEYFCVFSYNYWSVAEDPVGRLQRAALCASS